MLQAVIHRIRNGMARIGLGHPRNTFHNAVDRLVEESARTNAPIVVGTLRNKNNIPVTLALGVGVGANAELLALTEDE